MTFKVEDGTAMVDSNSYASVAEADAYWGERGNADWLALSSTVKQQSLVKATDYIDQRFGGRWIGQRATEEQALDWPQDNTGHEEWDYTNDVGVIPVALKKACIEYADRARAAKLAPDPTMDDAGVSMVTVKEEVGPIKVESQPVGGYSAVVSVLRPYPGADMYMRALVVTGNRVIHA